MSCFRPCFGVSETTAGSKISSTTLIKHSLTEMIERYEKHLKSSSYLSIWKTDSVTSLTTKEPYDVSEKKHVDRQHQGYRQ